MMRLGRRDWCKTSIAPEGMGALEYEPASDTADNSSKELQVQDLVELASIAFAEKESLDTKLSDKGDEGLLDILSVSASAGGARAKAVIAYNEKTRSVCSDQFDLPPGYEHWLIKFDGVQFSGDWGIADPAGYGLLEYSYYEMARQSGIQMMESRLLHERTSAFLWSDKVCSRSLQPMTFATLKVAISPKHIN